MTPWRFQLVPLEVVGGPQHSVDSHGRGASARIEEKNREKKSLLFPFLAKLQR